MKSIAANVHDLASFVSLFVSPFAMAINGGVDAASFSPINAAACDDEGRAAASTPPLRLLSSQDDPHTLTSRAREDIGKKFKVLTQTDQIHEFQTILRDKETTRSHFKFVADRLIRLVIEEGLNQLPYSETLVTTPTGREYKGLRYERGNCGVSIIRSGEAMEKALQDCCRSMRIGKILVDSNPETHEANVIFAKFPSDVAERKVLLLYPIMSSGNKVCKAMEVLKDNKVPEEHVILINLFCTPKAAARIVEEFPKLTVLTTEIHEVTPDHFGQKYFGTDHTDY